MPSPFPGMDPYVEDEKLWPVFQRLLASNLYQMLLPGLVDRYRAKVNQRCYTTEEPLFTSIIKQERVEEFIEIRLRSDNRLVTLIDIASPINKTLDQGRTAYLATRKMARTQGAGIVEIDLVTQGKSLLEYNREGLPEWDYAVTINRCTQPDKYEIYTSGVAKRLPRFKVPLAPDDRDTVMDLQSVFNRAFEQGSFTASIDYSQDPPYRMDDAKLKWIDDWFKQLKIRT